MRDLIIEEILLQQQVEHTRSRGRKAPIVPAASRYPHSAKRAELERGRQPRSQQKALQKPAPTSQAYL